MEVFIEQIIALRKYEQLLLSLSREESPTI